MAVPEDDWRLLNVKHLKNVIFKKKTYKTPREDWDHDHCRGCWAKFAEEASIPDALHEGYTTTADYKRGENYEWICPECFEALKEQMNWQLVK